MEHDPLPKPLQDVLVAAENLEKRVLGGVKPSLPESLDDPELVRGQIKIAMEWFDGIKEYYGNPTNGEPGEGIPVPFKPVYPKSVLGYFAPKWRTKHRPGFENVADFLGPYPLELAPSGVDALAQRVLGRTPTPYETLRQIEIRADAWPPLRGFIQQQLLLTEGRARRLIQWVRDAVRKFQVARFPTVAFLRPDTRNRSVFLVDQLGLSREVVLGNNLDVALRAFAAEGTAQMYRRDWSDLQEVIPELKPFIQRVQSGGSGDNNDTFKIDDAIRERIKFPRES